MEFGAAIFFTDYAMGPVELGRTLEERGFESLWAPEPGLTPSKFPISASTARFPACRSKILWSAKAGNFNRPKRKSPSKCTAIIHPLL